MEITFNTPALLFPAISLLLLAYTNRYLALANLIRKLHDEYMRGEKKHLLLKQIKILRIRINMVRQMQGLGVFSFLCCVISMYGVYAGWAGVTKYVFALSLLSLLTSLIISLLEISQSTKALEWELSDMEELEKTNFFSDLWGKGGEKKNLNLRGMRNWFTGICLGTAIMMIFASCSKGGATAGDGNDNGPHINNPSDTIPPVVAIATPVPDQVFTTGNVINVTGKVTDGDGLYRGSIRIVNNVSGAVLKEQLYEIHGILQYNFSVSYSASVTVVSDYTVTVSFEDHGQNITSKSVKVNVNP